MGIAFQQMGFTTQGVSMAMRGAANNVGFLLQQFGQTTAIIGTAAVIAFPMLIDVFLKSGEAAELMGKKVDAAGSQLRRMQDFANSAEDSIRSLTDAERDYKDVLDELAGFDPRKKQTERAAAAAQFISSTARP